MNAVEPGNIFIVSAASGTGKTTLVSRLTAAQPQIRVSVSHTTRAPREGEEHGCHYYFVSREEFVELIGQGAFLEHAEVFGNFYGTGIESVRQMSEAGYDVILEIDVQGAAQVRRALPEAVGIFILPPSLAVLAERLRGRGTDSDEVIERRLALAAEEIQEALSFDYAVINHDLDQAEAELLAIVRAQRCSLRRQRKAIEKILQNT
jgi:guanylate kinase